MRHAFIAVGGGFGLALRAETADVFWAVHGRIDDAGAGESELTDLGPLVSVGFTDPDGLWGEVCWERPADEDRGAGATAGWKYIPYPSASESGRGWPGPCLRFRDLTRVDGRRRRPGCSALLASGEDDRSCGREPDGGEGSAPCASRRARRAGFR